MKKAILLITLFLVACGPRPSSLPAVEFPDQISTMVPTPTLAVLTKPIEEHDVEEAYEFFYEMKNLVALGEYEHFAEEIRYPITATVAGQPKTFIFVAEFEADFEKIFDEQTILTLISTDESELTFTPQGIRVADGILWFDLICMDPACEEAEYLITEVNN
jgi:hypothetical protein